MSHTRGEVLDLLKQFEQEFTVFEGDSESFILDLIKGNLSGRNYSELDFEKLSKATFILPHCHIEHRKGLLKDFPEWFLKKAKADYLYQISINESRIIMIQELAQLFENSGVKILFLKGAAELACLPDDMDFLGRRYMCDIDLLCAAEDITRADELLRSNKHVLWDHNQKHWSRQEICDFTLGKYSHYIYNVHTKKYMELHGYVSVGANRSSYPPDFEKLLLEQSVQVNVRGTSVWVPKPEHLLVHSLCHAASKNNNQELVYLDRFYLDEFAHTDCVISPPVLIGKRLELNQLRFLLQFKDVLARFSRCLNFSEIRELLHQVSEKDLNEMYVMIASYVFKERFPLIENVSYEAIKMSRQRYVYRFMLPLLAERIENIIANRLEKITADYIEQQVETIAVTIARRMAQRVTENIVHRGKSFVNKKVAKVLSKSVNRTQEV
jgi:hypothetical protein